MWADYAPSLPPPTSKKKGRPRKNDPRAKQAPAPTLLTNAAGMVVMVESPWCRSEETLRMLAL